MRITWYFKLWDKSEPVFSIKESGVANFYTIFKEGNWFAQIQMNGEMTVPRQRDYLNNIINKLNEEKS